MFSLRRLLLLIACLAVVAANRGAGGAYLVGAVHHRRTAIRHPAHPHNIAGVQLDIVGVRGNGGRRPRGRNAWRSITSWCT